MEASRSTELLGLTFLLIAVHGYSIRFRGASNMVIGAAFVSVSVFQVLLEKKVPLSRGSLKCFNISR